MPFLIFDLISRDPLTVVQLLMNMFPLYQLSIMSCCVVGSMMVLWSVSIPLWASLEMIFLNTLYHQTEQGYNNVKVAHPLNVQGKERGSY